MATLNPEAYENNLLPWDRAVVSYIIEDLKSTLEGGPWTMDHHPFILRKWTPQVRMENERLSSIPIWIRLPNLPLHLWEEDCLSYIGGLLGVPLLGGRLPQTSKPSLLCQNLRGGLSINSSPRLHLG
ncbi:hypothetical protein QJS10_CPB20g00704 [Acorus calamus]|uniref:DUF4283 domain-containing protein n=1 Tax=Acorus calamus TaxID=4465 RepID=A0AAV9C8N5_ACOCL|nr:hypothetical protein QJS10_CPB20g00704 [Acorus calamus]